LKRKAKFLVNEKGRKLTVATGFDDGDYFVLGDIRSEGFKVNPNFGEDE